MHDVMNASIKLFVFEGVVSINPTGGLWRHPAGRSLMPLAASNRPLCYKKKENSTKR
jgi:hypothetical protein